MQQTQQPQQPYMQTSWTAPIGGASQAPSTSEGGFGWLSGLTHNPAYMDDFVPVGPDPGGGNFGEKMFGSASPWWGANPWYS